MSVTLEAATGIYLPSIQADAPKPVRPSRVIDRCIAPLLERDLTSSTSFAVNPAVFVELSEYKSRNPKDAGKVRRVLETLKRRQLESGIAMPFGNIKVPDLPLLDMEAVIKAGIDQFPARSNPKMFFPYASYSWDALQFVAKYGASAIICDPQDIEANGPTDNTPSKITIEKYYNILVPKRGSASSDLEGYRKEHERYQDHEKRRIEKSIVAIPVDRQVSGALAFQDKTDPAQFARDYFAPRLDGAAPNDNSRRLNITMTDARTYGLWSQGGDVFLEGLLNEGLAEQGIQPITLGKIPTDITSLPEARFKGGTAWHAPGADRNPIYRANLNLNYELTWLMKDALGLSNNEYIRFLAEKLGQPIRSPDPESGEYLEYILFKAKTTALESLRLPEASVIGRNFFRRNYKLGLKAIDLIEKADLEGTAMKLRAAYEQDARRIVS